MQSERGENMHKKLWNKDFILLLQGNAVSSIGDLMYSVAIGYWVYAQTGSNALMGIMSAISMFVTMFLSPFTGSIIDKCNRKWVMIGMDVMQGIVMLTGDIGDVIAAVDAGSAYAEEHGLFANKSVIPAPHPELWEQL